MTPFRAARDFLATIPGVSLKVAEVIIAETGADMSVFATPGHFAFWGGTAPGANESAGRVKSTKTRPGNRYLKRALGPRPWRSPAPRQPTWAPDSGASNPAGDR
jgi:transposase